MPGTIKLEIKENRDVEAQVRLEKINFLDEIILVDAMVSALKFDKAQRVIVGHLIAAGGMASVFGKDLPITRVDLSELKKMKDDLDNGKL